MTSSYTFFKRALLGKPIPTDKEHTTRLSKKIALPVFSSDAISSTAYATEEILVVLVAAGLTALRFSVPIAIAVAALLAHRRLVLRADGARVPERGRLVHRGEREPGHVSRSDRGRRSAGRLRDDRSGQRGGGHGRPHLGFPAAVPAPGADLGACSCCSWPWPTCEGCGNRACCSRCRPTRSSLLCGGLIVVGLARQYFFGGLPPAVVAGNIEATKTAGPVADPAGLLRGVLGHDGDRGHLERGAGLQAARESQRRHHPGLHGRDPRHAADRHHVDLPRHPCRAAGRRDRSESDRALGVREQRRALLRPADCHHGDPGRGCPDEFRRLPAPVVDPCP